MKGNLSAQPASHDARDSHSPETDPFKRIFELENEAAWKLFFEWSRVEVLQLARRKGLSAVEAGDLFQDVMLVVVRKITSSRSTSRPSNIRAWVRSIASHKACDRVRRRITAERLDGLSRQWNDGESDNSGDSVWQVELLPVVLNNVRERTSPEDFNVFTLAVLRGYRVCAIAQSVKKSIESVYRAKNRVLAAIRAEFQHLDDSPF
jgi:RNA polymerase sigma factor (sigma-70 family)